MTDKEKRHHHLMATNWKYYIKEAIKSDRTTLIGELEKQGQSEMANIIRRL